MKKFYLALCLVMTVFSGWGQLLKYEPFNYPADASNGLYTQSGTAWTRINTGDSIFVVNGSLSYPGLQSSVGNKVNLEGIGADYWTAFTSSTTTGSVYASFIMNVTSIAGMTNTTTGGYFTGLLQDGSTSSFGATVWTRLSATAGKYNIGIAARTTNTTVTWLPGDYDPGTSYFIVTAYDFVAGANNDIGRIWVNPVLGGTEPAAMASSTNTTALADLTSVARVFLRQDAATTIPNIDFDEFRAGSDWASVTPSSTISDPTTTSISPTSATAGGPGFTLTVNGTNFVSGQSTVTWNGSPRTTTFVSATQLTAAIPASDIASAGTAQVGVTTTGATNPSNTQTFTINAAATPSLSTTALTAFGPVCINTTAGPNSFTINGSNLNTTNVTVGALAGYTYSTTSGGTYTTTLSLTQPGGTYSQQVFVKFEPTAVQSYDGNIPVSGGGATATSVAASGSGINTPATVTSGAASNITYQSATLPGNITSAGCGTVTAYGVEYSTTSGFANGTGTQVAGTNLSGSSFTVDVTGLNPTTTYYYKAWATTSAGTSYSTQQSFTTTAFPVPAAPVANPATAVTTTGFTANWTAVAGATNYYLDVYTQGPGQVTTLLSGWNMDGTTAANLTADTGNVNNINIQVLDTNGTTAAISYPGGPTPTSGINPNSVSTSTWNDGMDTKYWQVDVNTTGATNIRVSSLQGSSSTGPKEWKLQYKVGTGGTWADVAGAIVDLPTGVTAGSATNWGAINATLPAAADNQPLVSLRWIMTSNTAINGSPVGTGGTSRISAIYVRGDVPGTVNNYVTGYQNLSVGNVTSYAVTGLNPSTNYFYVVRAENAGGSSANSNEISVTTATPATPTLSAGTLSSFGAQCINTTGGPNSFTLNGSNLTATSVTVGPLAGYSFSTTSGGTYTSTLTLTPTGGAISQTVFVNFTPTAVQSYDGNIPVSGGGAAPISVAATGSGVNTPAAVTTGSATAITATSATAAGTITATGCGSVTAYGIEYSTTNGFANGTGTQVSSTNLSGGNFSASLSGLTAGTVYYYKAYATNGAGTSYGAQQSFTTLTPVLTAGTVTDFGSVTVGSQSASQSFTISGTNLTGAPGVITITAPSTDFQVSNNNTTWGSSTTVAYSSATLASTPVYVRFTPQSTGAKTGNVTVAGGGAPTVNVAVSGTGTSIAMPAAPVATAATAITPTGFTANWNAVAGATGYRLDVYTMTAAGGSSSLIAGWNTDVNTAAAQIADSGNVNNIGIQSITGSGLNVISYPTGPSGSTGSPNPYSVSANGWDNGANTKYWTVDVNTTGATNITVSSLQGASNTGPKDFKLQYKVGAAGTWTDVAGGNVTLTTAVIPGTLNTWGALTDLPLPAAADNQPLVSLRWLSTGNIAVNGSPVSATGTSRISAIYIKGSTGTGPGTPVYVTGYQNLAVGNVTSYAVTGLASSTNYYYVVRAENASGASANSNEISVTTLAGPTLNAGPLAPFGNVCVNTTAGPNSFTITGSNLSNGSIVVGPLPGFTFSTTSGGTYTNSVTIAQPGGNFSQTVFVKFTPTAVLSFDGSIPVAGGGLPNTVGVPASGAGVNTAPAVTTGTATSVTNVSAIAPGTITNTGCTAITAYGIEYSTTSGFANGSGTQVPATNLAGGNFNSSLTGLTANTTYYFKAYATNSGGTTYGTQQSFTTLATAPVILSATTLAAFGSACVGTTVGPNSFVISGSNLTTAPVTVGALAGFTYSTTATGVYTPTLSLTQPGGAFAQTIYVKFSPAAMQSYNGNIPVGGGGATTVNVGASGTGSTVAPTVTTGTATSITTHSATVSGTINTTGCPDITSYGIEYSTINGFAGGTGTKVISTNNTSGGFTATLSNLVQGAIYYYRAFATNAAGTAYGSQEQFAVNAIPSTFTVYPVPARAGGSIRFSIRDLNSGYHGVLMFNSLGQKVYDRAYYVQSGFLNEAMVLPHSLSPGVYRIQVVTATDVVDTKTIVIFQ